MMEFKGLEVGSTTKAGLHSVELAVTSRCNFRCDYCCAFDLNEKRTLTSAEAISVLENLPDLQRVKLSGGEVLLRFDDCAEIVEWCSGRGLHTQINSNGTLLDRQRIERLSDAGLSVLHVSLNHVDAESHSAFYRVRPSVFETIVNSIRLAARDPSIEVVVETILFSETRDRLTEINHFAYSLGVAKHELQAEIPSVHEGYRSTLTPAEVADAIARLVRERHPRTALYFSCLSAYFDADSPYWSLLGQHLGRGVEVARCIEGKSQLHVHSTGEVMICELGWPEVIGNVFETPLVEIYRHHPAVLQSFLESGHDQHAYSCYRQCSHPGEPRETASRSRQERGLVQINVVRS